MQWDSRGSGITGNRGTYIYELAGSVNKFYHETRILSEEDAQKKAGYIALIGLAKEILEQCINILGFSAPEKM